MVCLRPSSLVSSSGGTLNPAPCTLHPDTSSPRAPHAPPAPCRFTDAREFRPGEPGSPAPGLGFGISGLEAGGACESSCAEPKREIRSISGHRFWWTRWAWLSCESTPGGQAQRVQMAQRVYKKQHPMIDLISRQSGACLSPTTAPRRQNRV